MKSFLKKLSSFFLEGGLKETVLRFPLSTLCAFALFVLPTLSSHDIIDDDRALQRAMACLVTGFFWFGGIRLVTESRGWTNAKGLAWALGVFIPFALLMAIAEQFGQYLFFVIPAVLLFLMVSPFTKTLREAKDDFSFWQFNHTLWVGVVVSMLAVGLMMGGLHAAVASIEALFNVDIPHKIMGDLWAFSGFFVGPIYALSWVPKTFEFKEEEYKEPTGLAFMLNWILAPLILIYFLILYAYLVKIIMAQSLPLGTLAYMVTGFAGVSIATYLAGWPLRDKCGALLRKIYKYLFPALAIPVVLQFLAIGERVNTYGVTEQRYMVVLSAVWLSVIIALFVFKKITSIKIIPALLAALFFLAAFGPWGAVGLSGTSQFRHLEKLLVQYEVLQEGKIVKTTKDISFEARKNISSKLDYLKSTDRFDGVLKFLTEEQKKSLVEEQAKNAAHEVTTLLLDKRKSDKYRSLEVISVRDVTELMGFQFVGEYQRSPNDERFDLNGRSHNGGFLAVKGYGFISNNMYAYTRQGEGFGGLPQSIKGRAIDGVPKISWGLNKENVLSFEVKGRGSVDFDLTDMVVKGQKNLDKNLGMQDQHPMILEESLQGMKIRLILSHISGKIEGEVIQVENVSFTMLLDL